MVRSWHPSLIDILDEERLTANHSEAHMMMHAIDGARNRPLTDRVGWWSHPEVQVWAPDPARLALTHDLTVQAMGRRGYKSGVDHQTSAIFESAKAITADLFRSGLAEIGYKSTFSSWRDRDLADLYDKWDRDRIGPRDQVPYDSAGVRRIAEQRRLTLGNRQRRMYV
jgi:hypothetical protein